MKEPLLLGVVCDLETVTLPGFGPLPHHVVFERYLEGLLAVVDAAPVLVPALARHRVVEGAVARRYLASLDGLVCPGGASNVHPARYGAPHAEAATDVARDGTAIPLLALAVEAGVPVLGICRGMQELNVALGGTLAAAVHEIPGRRDHRSRRELPFEERYRPAHPLRVVAGGWLDRMCAHADVDARSLSVNSLHAQAVDTLGRGVVVEATADDGTVEMIRVEGSSALAIGVQWHLEWHVAEARLHRAILQAFGEACASRASDRRRAAS